MLVQGDWQTEQREYARALDAYQAAHAIMQLPSTGLAVAKTLVSLGRLVEARDTLMSVARIPVDADEPGPIAEARVNAAELARALETRIPTVQVVARGGDAPTRVELDGRELPREAARHPYKVDPGEHSVRVTWPDGRQAERRFSLKERQHEQFVFEAAPVTTPVQAPRHPTAPPAGDRATENAGSWSPLTYAGLGTAAVALTAGAVTGLMAWSRTSKLESDCPGLRCECADEACRSARQGDIDAISNLATISNVAFAIGVIGGGVGTYGLLTGSGESSDTKSAARVEAFAGWGRVGVQGEF